MQKPPVLTSKTVKALNKWKRDIAPPNTYQPFHKVRKVNKVGRRHWLFCPRQKRHVHLLSDGELRMYKKLLWSPGTLEVLEQYALDIDETMSIAQAADIIHPRKWRENEATIMTTDFVVRRRCKETGVKTVGYTFKYFDQIYQKCEDGRVGRKNTRTWQKFSIEREYWRRRGIEYRVVTEKDATKACAWNINYFETEYDAKVSEYELKVFCVAFIEIWSEDPLLELQQTLHAVASELKTSFQRTQTLFKKAGLHRLIPLDIESEQIRLFRPVRLFIS